jgi:Ca2+-binding RTX toxin-like protein
MAVVTATDFFKPPLDTTNFAEDLRRLPGSSEMPGGIAMRAPDLYLANYGYGGMYRLTGVGLTYDAEGKFSGGTVTGWQLEWNSAKEVLYSITGLSVPAAALRDAGGGADVDHPVDMQNVNLAPILFGGDDRMTGASGNGDFAGYDGNDVILAAGGADTVAGNQGADTLDGGQGDDLLYGGKGSDVLIGGDGGDRLQGELGDDSLQGNRGNDTIDGGDGADGLRGGQGDDLLTGGAGNDWIIGDLGMDTLVGGAGADTFHVFKGAGVDRVLDFNPAEGDVVVLGGEDESYSIHQEGADTVIQMGAVDRLVLVGFSRTDSEAWLFLA